MGGKDLPIVLGFAAKKVMSAIKEFVESLSLLIINYSYHSTIYTINMNQCDESNLLQCG